jgi:hypothetical protein
MTLVVETGEGLTNANSYIDVAFADAYHTEHGNGAWLTADTTTKNSALIEATQSIELLYGQEYASIPMASYPLQALLFPRFTMIINKIQIIQSRQIPVQLKKAVAEVALMKINNVNIFPLPNTDNLLDSFSKKVGPLEKSWKWAKNPFTEKYVGFNKVELILTPILSKPKATSNVRMGL